MANLVYLNLLVISFLGFFPYNEGLHALAEKLAKMHSQHV